MSSTHSAIQSGWDQLRRLHIESPSPPLLLVVPSRRPEIARVRKLHRKDKRWTARVRRVRRGVRLKQLRLPVSSYAGCRVYSKRKSPCRSRWLRAISDLPRRHSQLQPSLLRSLLLHETSGLQPAECPRLQICRTHDVDLGGNLVGWQRS